MNWDNIKYPSSNADIQKLEDNNEGKLSINVYHTSSELQSETILLYRRSKKTKTTYEIDPLKLEEGIILSMFTLKFIVVECKEQIIFVDIVLMVSPEDDCKSSSPEGKIGTFSAITLGV